MPPEQPGTPPGALGPLDITPGGTRFHRTCLNQSSALTSKAHRCESSRNKLTALNHFETSAVRRMNQTRSAVGEPSDGFDPKRPGSRSAELLIRRSGSGVRRSTNVTSRGVDDVCKATFTVCTN